MVQQGQVFQVDCEGRGRRAVGVPVSPGRTKFGSAAGGWVREQPRGRVVL